jgi:3',5'-cyclic AMP phosphodiesterase CpdA
MKNLIIIIISILLLGGGFVAISAYLGRDIFVSLQNNFENAKGSNGSRLVSKFAVISDTHSDGQTTKKALAQIKNNGASFVVHTGDWTTVGSREELTVQKELFDNAGLSYWGIMGDHDRWDSEEINFEAIFGRRYESFEKNGILHILLDSSDLNNGLGDTQLDWLELLLKRTQGQPKLIFMHLPPYHPSSDRTVSSKGGQSEVRENEVDRLLSLIKKQNVLAIFSGDHHLSASYTEPKTSVRIFISGAATIERNLQSPRWSFVEVYENGFVSVEDRVIN